MASKFKITSHKVKEEITVLRVNAKYGNSKASFDVEMRDGKVHSIMATVIKYIKSTPPSKIQKHKQAIIKHLEK